MPRASRSSPSRHSSACVDAAAPGPGSASAPAHGGAAGGGEGHVPPMRGAWGGGPAGAPSAVRRAEASDCAPALAHQRWDLRFRS